MRAILLAGFLLAVAMQLLLPPWMGEDELWHVEYATLVARGHSALEGHSLDRAWLDAQLSSAPLSRALIARRFPSADLAQLAELETEILAGAADTGFERRVDWAPSLTGATTFDLLAPGYSAAHQPPLYYQAVGTAARCLGIESARGVLLVGRGLALVAYLAVLWATFRAALQLGLGSRAASIAGLTLVLWPAYAVGSSTVSNDVFARLFTALALLAATRVFACLQARRRLLPETLLFVAIACIAVASKPTAIAVPLGLAIGLGLALPSRKQRALLAAGLAVVTAGLWLSLDASPVTAPSFARLGERLQASFEPTFWRGLLGTATGTFNWQSRALPTPLILAAIAALTGLALGGVRALWRHERRAVLLLLLLPLAAQLAIVMLRGVGIGRYLFPAMPVLALLVGAGFEAAPRRSRPLLIALAAFTSIWLTSGLFFEGHILLGLP